MLSPYTRHYAPCKQVDISYRRCKCPKWVQGNLPDGRYLRKSAKTRSWEKANCSAADSKTSPIPTSRKPGHARRSSMPSRRFGRMKTLAA